MNTTPPPTSPDASTAGPSNPRRTASSTSDPRSPPRAARPAKHARRATHAARRPPSDPPFDVEALFELPEATTRAIQKLVTERPITSLLGAFGVGFMVGGGWRTRVGRVVALATMRHLALQAAEHYYGA